MFRGFVVGLWVLFSISIARAQHDFAAQVRTELESQGFARWEWLKSQDCFHCEMVFVPLDPSLRTENVRRFMQALSAHKEELLTLYRVSGPEYNLLAQMAVGILGRESRFFESPRYRAKEAFPWAVHLMKILRAAATGAAVDQNSRGPTQIKIVPARIARHYQVTTENLNVPENAALATIGFLIEALDELKTRIVRQHLNHINENNYADYLPYIYFGATRLLIKGEAHPEKNIYVRDMKKYMSWIEVYERAPLAAPVLQSP